MTYALVKFKDNWADEFDVQAFRLFPKPEWDKFLRNVDKYSFPREHHFGSNQSFEWETKVEYLSNFTVVALTEAEYNTIMKAFALDVNGWQGATFGKFPDITEDYDEGMEEGDLEE